MVENTDDAPLLSDEDLPSGVVAGTASDVPTLREDDAEEDALPPQAELLDDGRVRLPFRFPAQAVIRFKTASTGVVREEPYPELVMHRLNGADMRVISGSDEADRIVVAISRSARIHMGKMRLLFDGLDAADANAAAAVVGHFLGNGPKTGR